MSTVQIRKVISLIVIILLVGSFLGIKNVWAVGSCTANVSPSSVQANSVESQFTFSITNTGANNINYIRIEVPSSNFSLSNYGVSGWSVGANSQTATLTEGTTTAGNSIRQFTPRGGVRIGNQIG